MKTLWPHAALAAAACAAAIAWPLTAALPASDAIGSRISAVLLTIAVCAGAALGRNRLRLPRRTWMAAAALSGIGACTALTIQIAASASCLATYESRPVIIGSEFQEYVQPEPGATVNSILFDSSGVPERAWTPASIRWCRWRLGWVGMLGIPLFAACGCFLLQLIRVRLAIAPARAVSTAPPGPCRFDAFFSYRHGEPDRTFAADLLERLEAHGIRAVIDERDFRPNEHFLSEMERCVRESRFVLCVITPRYVASEHCLEEAVLSKTLDMAERTKRVVPLIFEPVELPVWLHGITGIDFTENSPVDGFEKLLALLARR